MKRKIAAILAADVVGYSKLVAEDEEETLRRLQSYRAVMDDFIAPAGGRIFNTAGDAVLAEFSSTVEAARCAIDIQESLRTRNMAIRRVVAGADNITPELRDDLARRLGNGGGWTAVAAGHSGKVGLIVKAASEQAAIEDAMSDCAKQDHSCRVIAIGPFAVEPK
jgi:class 3 adenylate cyclase